MYDLQFALLFSGILAGIYPDACTDGTIKFLKEYCRADILVIEKTAFQALLKVMKFEIVVHHCDSIHKPVSMNIPPCLALVCLC